MADQLDVLKRLPISAWDYPRVGVFVPIERTISYAWKFIQWYTKLAIQSPIFLQHDYATTDVARNRAVEQLLKSDLTHILMLDMDHIHPANIIQRLAGWFIVKPEVQVVGGLNYKRGVPYFPCCFIKDENGYAYPTEWESGLMPVDMVGTGSIMIAREVFEKMERPWFYYPYEQLKEPDGNYLSDDWGFAYKCKDLGIQQYVDTDMTSPHITEGLVTEETFREYDRQMIANGNLTEKGNGNYEWVSNPGRVPEPVRHKSGV